MMATTGGAFWSTTETRKPPSVSAAEALRHDVGHQLGLRGLVEEVDRAAGQHPLVQQRHLVGALPRTQNRLTLKAKTLCSRLTGTRRVARSIWRTVSRPASTYFWLRRRVRSTPDSERSIANSLPVVSRCADQLGAVRPAPQPISRMLSPGCGSISSTAQIMRGGTCCTGMASACQIVVVDVRRPVGVRACPRLAP